MNCLMKSVTLIHEDAEALDCVAEIEHGREIIRRGSSAHAQVRRYEEALASGASESEALHSVVDELLITTLNTGG